MKYLGNLASSSTRLFSLVWFLFFWGGGGYTLSLSLPLSLPLSFSFTLSLTLSLSPSLSPSLFLTHSLTHSLSLSRALPPTLYLTHSLTHLKKASCTGGHLVKSMLAIFHNITHTLTHSHSLTCVCMRMHIDTVCMVMVVVPVVRYITYRAGSFFAECHRLSGVKYTLSLGLVYFLMEEFLLLCFQRRISTDLN